MALLWYRNPMHKYNYTHETYESYHQKLHYHLYKFDNSYSDRKLIMLHGIRLGGLETFHPVTKNLNQWSEVLVPDLQGAGSLNPMNKTDHDFDLEMMLQSLTDLIDLHGWTDIDLLGYSYGGFLSKMLAMKLEKRILRHLIIESALLIDAVENLPAVGMRLTEIAELMHTNPDLGNQQFSELVSDPKQRRISLRLNTRPVHNPLGFANLLKIISKVYCDGDIWSIIEAQKSVTNFLSIPISAEKQNLLASIRKRREWKVINIDVPDHSFVFTHPELVANKINQWRNEG
jgi:pimeloyl-ACP methyl ester carboxylesterase